MSTFVNILSKVFKAIFEDVLQPLLIGFFQEQLEMLWDLLMTLLGSLLYIIYSVLLSFVDYLAKIFSIFSGTEMVSYKNKSMTILEVFFQVDQVKTAFLIVTALGIGLTFLFTIYKVGKSISDTALEDKNPISKVLKNGMKAAITFAMVPFLCLVMLQLCTLMTSGISTALSQTSVYAGNSNISIGTILFLSSSMDAAVDGSGGHYNISDDNSKAAFNDKVRAPYYSGKYSYTNTKQVGKDFDYGKFDYFTGLISVVFMIFVLLGAIFQFIRRLFEIIALYIVAPLFTSTIPLDDGALFSKWKDMFIAKFFSAFGSIFAIRIFLLLVPYISCGNLTFCPSNRQLDYFLKILVILGGAYSIFKSQHLILQILNPEAAMMDQQSSAMVASLVVGAAVGGASFAVSGTSGIASGVAGKAASGAASLSGGSEGSASGSSNKFSG